MTHLTLDNRQLIARLKTKKVSQNKIALAIGKAGSTVSDELKRNSINGEYDPVLAHAKTLQRQQQKTKATKLDLNPELKNYIIQQLRADWSPEQIAGDLRRQAGRTIISHETIYQFIYSSEGKNMKLWQHLRHRKKPKRISWGTRRKRDIIPARISIHERPPHINLRQEFGHYEGDLMIFALGWALAVFVERLTRRTFAVLLPNKTAHEMELALHELICSAGQTNIKSITFDNGGENVCHEKVRQDYGSCFDTYFCDPYCSWQKGLVENTNKLLRQYFPRDIPAELLTQDLVDEIVAKLNARPRKKLGYLTPSSVFRKCSV